MVEIIGDYQPKYPVTEELQALIIFFAVTAVGRGSYVKFGRQRPLVGDFGNPVKKVRTGQNVSPMRSQRAAVNQVQGLIHSAEPSVEKTVTSALPTRFSSGTMPIA